MNNILGPARGVLFASENLRGILLMIIARIVFAGSDTFTKLASEGLPASEVVALRNSIALPIVLTMAWRLGGFYHLSAVRDRVVLTRSVLEAVGTLTFVAALPHVMLGQSTVILLTVPIILVALSALVFKEDVGWRRWAAWPVAWATRSTTRSPTCSSRWTNSRPDSTAIGATARPTRRWRMSARGPCA